jgi:hypothetical protein
MFNSNEFVPFVAVLFKSVGGARESLKSSQTITGQKLDLKTLSRTNGHRARFRACRPLSSKLLLIPITTVDLSNQIRKRKSLAFSQYRGSLWFEVFPFQQLTLFELK